MERPGEAKKHLEVLKTGKGDVGASAKRLGELWEDKAIEPLAQLLVKEQNKRVNTPLLRTLQDALKEFDEPSVTAAMNKAEAEHDGQIRSRVAQLSGTLRGYPISTGAIENAVEELGEIGHPDAISALRDLDSAVHADRRRGNRRGNRLSSLVKDALRRCEH